jgi:hypothetical protein
LNEILREKKHHIIYEASEDNTPDNKGAKAMLRFSGGIG